MPFVGGHAAHEEQVGAPVTQDPAQDRARGLAVAREVQVDGQHAGAAEAGRLQLGAVELAVRQGQVHVPGQAAQLLPAQRADARHLGVVAREERGRRDVVVQEDAAAAVVLEGRGEG